ncbi:RnfABCDGE type electron transport complex subunit G [Pseudobutyrivibrio xylanivorans]|uniref:Ion-translocating oxidoreductase complex subunit G n=1 Tax=Pseudobutyrivibrio xylanivorans TaxID=185007 RepID=A0A5P6VVP2_PSEXY|nr:RnfABCDGE type electron transport complex subunit G [Pseudobutyrivibrio xylanivorans]QFJ55664.1 RnfABCDGE type electron transport complex subunit G [Pseudobutyrivibrio xylanivorans]
MNKLVKDALVLTCITVVAGFALGLVYEITKTPIANAKIAALQEAYQSVFADAASFEPIEDFDSNAATEIVQAAGYTDDTIDNVAKAVDASGNVLGYVITDTTKAGYGGSITFSIGITNDSVINGYSITSISETAGLGMKATDTGEGSFASQFVNRNAEIFTVTKTGASSSSEVDAISAATITSKAMTNGIDACVTYFNSLVGGAANE